METASHHHQLEEPRNLTLIGCKTLSLKAQEKKLRMPANIALK
jgi:hypothetical protein